MRSSSSWESITWKRLEATDARNFSSVLLSDNSRGVESRSDKTLHCKPKNWLPRKLSTTFRKGLETSFQNLQVDYVDLLSLHGCNMPHQYDWMFPNEEDGGCWQVVQEYVKAGKIKHVGFSTHAPPELIKKFIDTDKFEYCNLH